MHGADRKEYGDCQTPLDFCLKVCEYLQREGYAAGTEALLEPTCGSGSFLRAAASVFGHRRIFGIEINPNHARWAKSAVPGATVLVGSIFELRTRPLCGTGSVLICGNPPWGTSDRLSCNLPAKSNFKGLRGIDAVTGAAGFDISEAIILRLLNEYRGTDSALCMLCKTSAARKVVLEIERTGMGFSRMEMLNFDAGRVFGFSAPACLFAVRLSPAEGRRPAVCEVRDFDSGRLLDTLTAEKGKLVSRNAGKEFEGASQLTWRSGVKHDCVNVVELDLKDGRLTNRRKHVVDIEDDLVFPLAKSSSFKKPVLDEFEKFLLVTQTKPGQDTGHIRESCPRTWAYLNDNISFFTRRKSRVYNRSVPFSIFGTGPYSFAPCKVGLSGLYKKPLFSLLHSDKPVMTDDTCYFLGFEDRGAAYAMMLLLNGTTVQDFLTASAFLDSKRPYTAALLSRLDLKKCAHSVSLKTIRETEARLRLPPRMTEEMRSRLIEILESA